MECKCPGACKLNITILPRRQVKPTRSRIPGVCRMECKPGACKLKTTILPRSQATLTRSRIQSKVKRQTYSIKNPGACEMECKYPGACQLKITILPRRQIELTKFDRSRTQPKVKAKLTRSRTQGHVEWNASIQGHVNSRHTRRRHNDMLDDEALDNQNYLLSQIPKTRGARTQSHIFQRQLTFSNHHPEVQLTLFQRLKGCPSVLGPGAPPGALLPLPPSVLPLPSPSVMSLPLPGSVMSLPLPASVIYMMVSMRVPGARSPPSTAIPLSTPWAR